MCVSPPPRLLITSDMIWTPYDWLNNSIETISSYFRNHGSMSSTLTILFCCTEKRINNNNTAVSYMEAMVVTDYGGGLRVEVLCRD